MMPAGEIDDKKDRRALRMYKMNYFSRRRRRWRRRWWRGEGWRRGGGGSDGVYTFRRAILVLLDSATLSARLTAATHGLRAIQGVPTIRGKKRFIADRVRGSTSSFPEATRSIRGTGAGYGKRRTKTSGTATIRDSVDRSARFVSSRETKERIAAEGFSD